VIGIAMPGELELAATFAPAWRDVPVFIWTSMLLTDEEYASLARSARAILIKGGGSMEDMLECVRRWRLPEMITHQEGQP
jgi:hypothetical protein